MRISDWSSDVCSSPARSRPDDRSAFDLHLLRTGASVQRGVAAVGRARREQMAGRRLLFQGTHPGRQPDRTDRRDLWQIGSASCSERVVQYVSISEVALTFNKKTLYIQRIYG